MVITSIFQIKPYWLRGAHKCPTCTNKRLPHRYFHTREEAVAEIQTFVAANSFRQHRIFCSTSKGVGQNAEQTGKTVGAGVAVERKQNRAVESLIA